MVLRRPFMPDIDRARPHEAIRRRQRIALAECAEHPPQNARPDLSDRIDAVSERAGIPLGACLRRGGGHCQVGRRRAERLSDPPTVWAVRDAPRRALLVDDVWTTGATLSACARALREAGSRRIVALTLARAI